MKTRSYLSQEADDWKTLHTGCVFFCVIHFDSFVHLVVSLVLSHSVQTFHCEKAMQFHYFNHICDAVKASTK